MGQPGWLFFIRHPSPAIRQLPATLVYPVILHPSSFCLPPHAVSMLRAIFAIILLVLGAVALSRGLYLRAELIHQLETGTMGAIRSWVMWSTTDGRELVAWYRMVTPWLIWGGAGTLLLGLVVALWPERKLATSSHVPEGASGKASRDKAAKPPSPQRKPRKQKRTDA